MANEVYVSAHGNILQTEILQQELGFLLNQRPFALQLMQFAGDVSGSAADTIKGRLVDSDDIGEVVAEGAALIAGNTDLTDATFSVTPARIAIKRTYSELMAIIDSSGLVAEAALAMFNVKAVLKQVHALYATATQSLTGSVGSTGVDMSASDFFAAQQTMQSRLVEEEVVCHLHQEQFNNLQTDIRGEVGPWQLVPATQDMLSLKGSNFKGILNGIALWTSNQAPDANGGLDHGGAMHGLSAIAYGTGSPRPVVVRGGRILAPGGVIYTDIDTDLDKAEDSLVTNGFYGVSVREADRGVKIITDHV